jgi:hypothetical protein
VVDEELHFQGKGHQPGRADGEIESYPEGEGSRFRPRRRAIRGRSSRRQTIFRLSFGPR